MQFLLNRTVIAIKNSIVYIIICSCVFIFCFVGGFFVAKRGEEFLLFDAARSFIQSALSSDFSAIGYFFSKLVYGLIILFLITLIGSLIWLIPFHVVFIAIFALIGGVAFNAFFSVFSVIGIFFYFIIIFPSLLVRVLSVIILSCCCLTYCKQRKIDCSQITFYNLCEYFLLTVLIYVVAVLYETIMISIFIRPFGIYF